MLDAVTQVQFDNSDNASMYNLNLVRQPTTNKYVSQTSI